MHASVRPMCNDHGQIGRFRCCGLSTDNSLCCFAISLLVFLSFRPDAIFWLEARTVHNGCSSNKQNASCLFAFFFFLLFFFLFISPLFSFLLSYNLPFFSTLLLPPPFPPTADTLTLTLTRTHTQWPSLATLSVWLQHGQLFSSSYVLITKNVFFCQSHRYHACP